MIGRVVSTKMNKTVTILVERSAKHPLYGKSFTRTKKYLVDDLIGVSMSDLVEIEKVRPISKNKHWRIVKVVGRDIEEVVKTELKEEAKQAIEEVMPEVSESVSQSVSESADQQKDEAADLSEGKASSASTLKTDKPKKRTKKGAR